MNQQRPAGGVWSTIFLVMIGMAFGISSLLKLLMYPGHDNSLLTIVAGAAMYSALVAFILFLLRKVVREAVTRLLPAAVSQRYRQYDTYAYTVFIYPLLGRLGIPYHLLLVYLGGVLFVSAHALIIAALMGREARREVAASMSMVSCAFFISGGCALIYQIVWQRVLFAEFGCNIESITIIVSVFMFGLGIGSLLGGRLSKRYPDILPQMFMVCEAITGLFGIASIVLIKSVGQATLHNSLAMTFVVVFGLLFLPTMLMGATLPILVTYLHRQYQDVGRSVGILYFINTLGAALACFVTADILFALFGKQTTVILAALGNFVIVYLFYQHVRARSALVKTGVSHSAADPVAADEAGGGNGGTLGFLVVLFLSFVMGYVSLSQEILWFRAVSYLSGGRPTVFAHVLGVFLLGIALGSLFGKRICQRGTRVTFTFIAVALTASALLYFVSLPIVGRLFVVSESLGMLSAYLCVGMVAFLMGGIFPVLCHKGITSDAAVGASLSWIYFANIVGSTAGPLFTGFVLLDTHSLERNVLHLCLFILLTAGFVYLLANISWRLKGVALLGILAVVAGMVTVYGGMYANLLERLHYKTDYRPERAYKYLVQNRNGVVAVDPNQPNTVFGGGIYDGKFSIDPRLNSNGITRAYMVAALHPRPENILMIGLSSGSWAKVITHYADLKHLTAVEINPGYLQLIGRYPEIAPLLSDPRVTIDIDDGRRWLNRNPGTRYDLIVMNTTFHWREGSTNLLSADFLRICKGHLNRGGVLYYNATDSEDVIYTAARVFRYVVRVKPNLVAASDVPFGMTPAEIRQNMLRFRQNNVPDLNDAATLQRLENADISDKGEELRANRSLVLVTDDNMATEFKKIWHK